jgi:formylglycine-generating enzyme required for sulfatase activity
MKSHEVRILFLGAAVALLLHFTGAKTADAATLYGDANQDGTFALGDLNTLVDWILMRTATPAVGSQAFINADVNGSGTVDLQDLNLYVDRLLMRITKFPVETSTATLKGTVARPGTGSSKPLAGPRLLMAPASGETPLPGATVTVIGPNLTATTDADGHFTVPGVPPGTYLIQIDADTNGDGVPDLSYMQSATFISGGTVDLGTILLTVPGAIQGVATKEFQSAGNAGIMVFVPGTSYVGLTNDLGQFTIANVPPGTYSLRAACAGYQTAAAVNVPVSSGQTTTEILMNLLTAGGAAGTLAGDVKCLGLTDHSGTTITVLGLAGGNTAQTASDGSFMLVNVPSGVYQVTASHTGYQTRTFAATPILKLITTTLPAATLITGSGEGPNGTIQGLAALGGSVGNNSGISAWVVGTALIGRTDGGGAYAIPNVPPGTYSIQFVASGYYSLTVQGAMVTAGQNTNMPAVVLSAGVPPLVNAGSNQAVRLPASTVILSGSGTASGSSAIVGYSWVQLSGPSIATIANSAAATTPVTGLTSAGVYVFQVSVIDSTGAAGAGITSVTVQAANQPPVVSAGAAINLILPATSAALSGTASDADGTVVSVGWSQVGGPTGATIVQPATAATNVLGLTVAGAYTFRFTATDNNSATSFSDVIVNVTAAPNQPPAVNAGSDQQIQAPTTSTALSGTASDADGTVASTRWTQVSGPVVATIATPTSLGTGVTGLTAAGLYVFRLAATDDQGATSAGNVNVTVGMQVNAPPTANAGNNMGIRLPTTSVTLNGSGTDSDGTVVGCQWTQLSGPVTGVIANASYASTPVTGLTAAGYYVFRLTVTDNQGAIGTGTVLVTVWPVSQPPTASAGPDQTITLPANSVTLTGVGTDTGGTISMYGWAQVSGPVLGVIASPSSATTDMTGLTASGSYVFRLTVVDTSGLSATDDMFVSVLPQPNKPPIANGGPDQWIVLPLTSSATLSGAGVDLDGTIASCVWTQLSGPATAGISSPLSPVTAVTGLTSAGIYIFQITVTDNESASSSDKVTVTVWPAGTAPTAWSGTLENAGVIPVSGSIILQYPSGHFVPLCGGWVIVGNKTANDLETVHVATGQVLSRMQLTGAPARLAMDWDHETLYVTLQGVSALARVDHLIGDAVTYIPLSRPAQDVTIGNGGLIFAILDNRGLALIDGPGAYVKKEFDPVFGISAVYERQNDQLICGVNRGSPASLNRFAFDSLEREFGASQVVDASGGGGGYAAVSPDGAHVAYPSTSGWIDYSPIDLAMKWGTWFASSGGQGVAFSPNGKYFVSTNNNDLFIFNALTHALIHQEPGYGGYEGSAGVSRGNKIAYGFYFDTYNKQTTRIGWYVRAPIPFVNAGADQWTMLPSTSVQLKGTGIDSDDRPLGYTWSQISGPATAQIASPSSPSTAVTGLTAAGGYIFQLQVVVPGGDTCTDKVTVTVWPAGNASTFWNGTVDDVLDLPKISSINIDFQGGYLIPLCGGRVIIADVSSNSLDTFNIATAQVEQRLAMSGAPGRMAMDWDNQTLYVVSGTSNLARVEHLNQDAVTYIPIPGTIADVALAGGGMIFVSLTNGNIVLLDGPSGAIKTQFTNLPSVYSIKFSTATNELFTNNNNTLAKIKFDPVMRVMAIQQQGVSTYFSAYAVSPDGARIIYSKMAGNDHVFNDVSASNLSVVDGTYNMGMVSGPLSGAFTPDSKYVLGTSNDTLFIFDPATHQMVHSLALYGGGTSWCGASRGSKVAYILTCTVPPGNRNKLAWYVLDAPGAAPDNGYGGQGPTITAQPVNTTVPLGQAATFSVTATGIGTEPISYQWQWFNGGWWIEIPGATASSYSTSATVMDDNWKQFRCAVTSPGGSSTSNAATLCVNSGLSGLYLIIDLSAGPNAVSYPHTTQSAAPADLLANWSGPGGLNKYRTNQLVLRRIPAGTFMMGSPANEVGRFTNEDQHQVTLTHDFYISVFQVTQEQYRLVTGLTPSHYAGNLDHPVETLAWNDFRSGNWPYGKPAQYTFMGIIRAKTGLALDLPTDAQREYACRAGTTTSLNSGWNIQYPTGLDSNTDAVAWYSGNNTTSGEIAGPKAGGRKLVNAWGLYDMHGNINEMCLDWYVANLGTAAVLDPVGAAEGRTRVVRNGNFGSTPQGIRSAYREAGAGWSSPDNANIFGFRVTCVP